MEYGGVSAPGIQRLRREPPTVLTTEDEALPTLVRNVVVELQARLPELDERSTGHDRPSAQLARQSEAAKRGNVYLRPLLIHGARAVRQFTAKRTEAKSVWVAAIRQRRGTTSPPWP
jgi:hypothetical protein